MFLLLLFNIAFLKLSQCYEIKATGNGIIKPGTDLELSLVVNKVWDRHSVLKSFKKKIRGLKSVTNLCEICFIRGLKSVFIPD